MQEVKLSIKERNNGKKIVQKRKNEVKGGKNQQKKEKEIK